MQPLLEQLATKVQDSRVTNWRNKVVHARKEVNEAADLVRQVHGLLQEVLNLCDAYQWTPRNSVTNHEGASH